MQISTCNVFFFFSIFCILEVWVWGGVKLDQSPSEVKRPGETVRISCVTSVTNISYTW
uniref:Ig-like domain-containing protein n=1 Tax=Anabas testudineus TaxID=64144 RepID=A0AAQ6IIZ3_ANATE